MRDRTPTADNNRTMTMPAVHDKRGEVSGVADRDECPGCVVEEGEGGDEEEHQTGHPVAERSLRATQTDTAERRKVRGDE
jgi:hypothetical protein